jgi:hypothetical protein
MKDARIRISPINHTRDFGSPVRVHASCSGIEDFDVLFELLTDRDEIKVLCSAEWAFNLAKTLEQKATESANERKAKTF